MKSKKKIIAELENENKRLNNTLDALQTKINNPDNPCDNCEHALHIAVLSDTEIQYVPSMYDGCNKHLKYVCDGYKPKE